MAEGSFRGARCDSDVFVLVKEYISSTELRQAPLLVLPAQKAYPLVAPGRELFFCLFVQRKLFVVLCVLRCLGMIVF